MRNIFSRSSLYLAWLISIVATLGSFYFGEGKGNIPCTLCWYQRICLFPLVFILGVAAYKDEIKIWHYVIYQIILGMGLAGYQMLQDYISWGPALCGEGGKCVSYETFQSLPFPLFSFLSFLIILLFLLLQKTPQN